MHIWLKIESQIAISQKYFDFFTKISNDQTHSASQNVRNRLFLAGSRLSMNKVALILLPKLKRGTVSMDSEANWKWGVGWLNLEKLIKKKKIQKSDLSKKIQNHEILNPGGGYLWLSISLFVFQSFFM